MTLVSIIPSEMLKDLLGEYNPDLLNNEESILKLSDFKTYLKQSPDICVHQLLKESHLVLPKPAQKCRNPELDKRVKKLETEKENRDYLQMTRNLGGIGRQDNVASEVKSSNAMIAVVINFVLTVVGSFVFAFKALEYALPEPNIPAQVLLGVLVGCIVAAADLYFILKDL